jgi:large subunit ribosomal protein L5
MNEKAAAKKENPMKNIRIEKLTLNIGAGEAGPKLEKSQKLIEKITGKKIVVTSAHKRTTFGAAKGKHIGVKVALRGKEANEMVKKLLGGVENKISPSSFDTQGNFSFGIHEYINIPGVRYDPDIGIMGMDVCVTLERRGFRVKKRRIKSKIGKTHKISREDSMEFAKKEFGIKITEKDEE